MDYFGDVSGTLRSLLNKEEEVVVVGVVKGDKVSCARCAKRAVRKADDIPEARWNDLFETQKRRMFECLGENEHVDLGYAKITLDALQRMDKYHRIYGNRDHYEDWDLALLGYAYGEVMFEMGIREDPKATFTFDRTASKKQSEKLLNNLERFTNEIQIFYQGSRQVKGIQSADCLAGGVAEDFKSDTSWLDYLGDKDPTVTGGAALAQLENDLTK